MKWFGDGFIQWPEIRVQDQFLMIPGGCPLGITRKKLKKNSANALPGGKFPLVWGCSWKKLQTSTPKWVPDMASRDGYFGELLLF
jgi:hypothetical protein